MQKLISQDSAQIETLGCSQQSIVTAFTKQCCDDKPARPAFSQPAAASQVLKLAVGLLGSLHESIRGSFNNLCCSPAKQAHHAKAVVARKVWKFTKSQRPGQRQDSTTCDASMAIQTVGLMGLPAAVKMLVFSGQA